MSIEIREVVSKKDRDIFLGLPYRLYRNNRFYVPPLKTGEAATLSKEKNPAFAHCELRCWLAFKNNRPVGRIAGILNHMFISTWKKRYIRFGWFDFEEDDDIAYALLLQLETWAERLGMEAVHGPLGFTDFDHEGMLVDGFDQLATMAGLYNFAYYPRALEKAGYVKDTDWVEYRIKVPAGPVQRITRIADVVMQKYNLRLATLKSKTDLLIYADDVLKLIESSYAELYGFVPFNEEQKVYYTKQYLSFLRRDFVKLVLDNKGQLAALGIAMPSLSLALQQCRGRIFPFGFLHLYKAIKRNDTADLLIVAVRKDLQGKGVNAILMNETLKVFNRNGIRFVETNYQLESNVKVQSMFDDFEKVLHKRRRCYIKYLK